MLTEAYDYFLRNTLFVQHELADTEISINVPKYEANLRTFDPPSTSMSIVTN